MIDSATRQRVLRRAGRRCEYCRLHEDDDPLFTFHIEHIIAKQHGGRDVPNNLALACHQDNLHKGPNLTGIDPVTKKVTKLFNPRGQVLKKVSFTKGHLRERVGNALVHRDYAIEGAKCQLVVTPDAITAKAPGKHAPSLTPLKRYAAAVGCKIEIKLVPQRQAR